MQNTQKTVLLCLLISFLMVTQNVHALEGTVADMDAYNHTVIIKTDGSLWAWGAGSYGELGIGPQSNDNIPITAPLQVGSATDWKQVTAGSAYTMAVKTDGSLWGWGRNNYGQQGRGFSSSSEILWPAVIGDEDDWGYLTAGYAHTLALKTDGSLWCWGYNAYGQVGDSTTVQKNDPTRIGSETNWKTGSAGYYHTVKPERMELYGRGDTIIMGNWAWEAAGAGPIKISQTR